MSDQRGLIAQAPTVADVAASAQRVGTVDFTSSLLAAAGSEPAADAATATDDRVVPLTSVARPPRGAAEETGADQPRMPFILPPAKVDAAMAVEAERTRLAIATARGDVAAAAPVEDDTEDDIETDDATEESTEESTDDVEAEGQVESEPLVADLAELTESAEVPELTELTELETVAGVEGLWIPSLAQLAAPAPQREAAPAPTAPAAPAEPPAPVLPVLPVASLEAEPAATVDPVEPAPPLPAAAPAAPAPVAPVIEHLVTGNAVADPAALVREVADVAAGIVASMRRVNVLHERHVEALAIEAARRCELLTAQAELDAELIRLHARREAHAIISAARPAVATAASSDHLGEIGETFSRFAETIETTVAPATSGAHDHPRKS